MALDIGPQYKHVEIDGTAYHLPQALTPGLRVTKGDVIAKFREAQKAWSRKIDDAGPVAEQVDKAKTAAAKRKIDDEYTDSLEQLRVAMADAARGLVVSLLRPASGGDDLPKDVADGINDVFAIEYAVSVIGGGAIDLDPS